MNRYLSQSNRTNRLANLFVFLCVFVTDSMSLPFPQSVKVVFLTLICAVIVFLDLAKRNFCLSKNEIAWVIFPSALLISTQIMSWDLALSYESKILMMYAGFILSRNVPFVLFREKYLRIIYIICIVSLVCWACGLFGIAIWNFLPSSGEGQYRTLFFHAFDMFKGTISERNNGPFWEPGVFQIYINIACILLLFDNQKINKKVLAVYLLTLLTTISTTGYISFAIIMLA